MYQISDGMDKISKAQVKLVRSLQQKKFRDETGLFVAEGEKCVSELCKAFELVYRIQSADRITDHSPTTSLLATPTEIEQMSGLRTPQGVIGVFKKRPIEEQELEIDQWDLAIENLALALDGIQDPGNLGTIIRTCDWFGVHDIICSQDTADCYNPKVVQATMGSISRVNLIYINLPQMLDNLPADFPVYGTFLDGRNIYEEPLSQEGLIIMGNEGNGISDAVRSRVNRRLLIPDFHQGETADSLNVAIATAITCSEFRRRK